MRKLGFGWGNIVECGGTYCVQTPVLSSTKQCSVFCLVYKRLGFPTLPSQLLLNLFHSIKQTFIPVNFRLLPIINKTYKNNNELNKFILLPGGCL